MMMKVTLSQIERITSELLGKAGLNEENVKIVTDIYMRATYHGVGHHDIHNIPGTLRNLTSGKIKSNPSIVRLHQHGALESYEGDNGLGEYCGAFVMKRAMHLAEKHGISLCSIRNSNHLLACSPYVEMAAENGYIGYIITRGAPTMGAPGRKEKVIGTSPMGYAAPADKDYPIMFDACLSYASFGALDAKMKAGESVPSYWGLNAEGNPSTDPAAIANGTRLPIGGHKGFGLAILGEIITGVLSEGQIIDEPQPGTGEVGKPSHTAICIKADGLMDIDRFKKRISEMKDRMRSRAENLRIPGQRAGEYKEKILQEGSLEFDEEFINELNQWATKLGAAPIQKS